MDTKEFKPSAINSLIPELIKNMLYAFIYIAPIFLGDFFIKRFNLYPEINQSYFYLAFIIISLIPTLLKAFTLGFTTYYFLEDHVYSEFKFIAINRHSLPYNKITNITTNISIWDRMTNAGDVILHTAEDKHSDLTLKYINNPDELEKFIYQMLKINNDK
jgi:hypothetical protein